MKILVAVLMGGCSGGLLCLAGGMLLVTGARPIVNSGWPAIAAILLFGGWALSSYGLLRGAESASQVIARGLMLGAVEWLAMIGVGLVRPAITGVGIFSAVFISGPSLLLSIACLAGYGMARSRLTPATKPGQMSDM